MYVKRSENVSEGGSARGRGRGRARTRGGGAQRVNLRIGHISELPTYAAMETPLHIKRRRMLPATQDGYSSSLSWSSMPDASAPQPQASTSAASGAAEADNPTTEPAPQPQAFVECGNTPRSSSSRQQNPRRLLRDEEINFVNYGSEEEEDDDDDLLFDNQPFIPPVLRSVRVLTEMAEETLEDSPIELEAAGRIEDDVLDADVAGPTRLYDFKWVPHGATPICPVSRRESFVGQCGPTRGPIASAYEAFVSIWDRPIMDHIVQQTNKYAQGYATHLLETGQMGPNSRINRWCDTNVDEVYTYLAIVIAMGIIVKPRLNTYWNRSADIFQSHGFAAHMSLRRFELLSKCLHFNNNDHNLRNLTPPQAKLFKISPILDHLNDRFQSLYYMDRNIALDESLTQWKGWLNFKQYIPNKAAQVGIKTYEVCDSRSGYLWRFEVHAGSHISEGEEVIPGQIPNLVLRLLRGLEHRGHTIWMDNYYNSPSLARVLKTRGFDCVGTLRTNRQFVPDQIKDLKKPDMAVGEVYGCTSGDVDIVAWRDNNLVALISTYHGATVSDNKPTVIKDYNICMGGVDKKDQMLAAYPLERKRTRVWYKKFFRKLLNVSVLNSYILFKTHHPIDHLDFRMNLVLEILSKHCVSPEMSMSSRGPKKFSAQVLSHMPMELPVGDNVHGRTRRKCVVCKAKKTHIVCKACNVHLCYNFTSNCCFLQYHS
ncbi:hypothetical protein evm_007408 [Chilo suppressalis]|nr:hypothetical protein evm_007408 [Chilo suppressalis]